MGIHLFVDVVSDERSDWLTVFNEEHPHSPDSEGVKPLICQFSIRRSDAFLIGDQLLSVNDLDIAAARATQPATIR